MSSSDSNSSYAIENVNSKNTLSHVKKVVSLRIHVYFESVWRCENTLHFTIHGMQTDLCFRREVPNSLEVRIETNETSGKKGWGTGGVLDKQFLEVEKRVFNIYQSRKIISRIH